MSDFNTLQLFSMKCQANLVIPAITKSQILLKLPTIVLYYFSDFSSGPSSLVLKMQNELHVISLGLLSMQSLLCVLA